jgi:hypothetical protein
VCSSPFPASCPVSGGGTVYMNISDRLGGAINTTVRFGSAENSSLATAAQIGKPWLSFVCPAAQSISQTTAYVLLLSGGVACSFAFAFVPGPASILPRTLPLSGGPQQLLLGDYFALFGPLPCTVVYGFVSGQTLQLAPVLAYNTSAPPADSQLVVPLSLACNGQPVLDLGVSLEYVRPPAVAVFGVSCVALYACTLGLNVTNPPRGVSSGSDLTVDILSAIFDPPVDASVPLLPVVQVSVYVPGLHRSLAAFRICQSCRSESLCSKFPFFCAATLCIHYRGGDAISVHTP